MEWCKGNLRAALDGSVGGDIRLSGCEMVYIYYRCIITIKFYLLEYFGLSLHSMKTLHINKCMHSF